MVDLLQLNTPIYPLLLPEQNINDAKMTKIEKQKQVKTYLPSAENLSTVWASVRKLPVDLDIWKK